ncbi:5-formyltetrahydrofolate cyclo-ligase [Alkalihalobacillus sp. MEB130]|uniref:5-formyltetrahydrofolate cyclo-ligase n=1 Tax=Alkalihalobacillus sp. MEB130 TaxID=2976704 RepID=UPI0028DECF54|nr:5-formyltetrahydrofolate cyclo-ligase [Alkalihalobacillus sp. MEB130]MDT8861731.1 5-formyltetrahydrofolate cyclo-ligase [Alkalihalobacillus sp. MEB130]
METKKEVRKKVSQLLEDISSNQWREWSKKIANHLIASSYWQEAEAIALTISRGKEVDTYFLIENAWAQGKTVVVPRANFNTREMTFYELTSFDQLEEGPYELKEPDPRKCSLIQQREIDLIIVPGLAFDKKGARLGFGGGFYDRFLACAQATTIALAFPCQMISTIPIESHDCKVDYVVTPEGFYC